jgi:D-alanyl-D-alanine carboxypeptidase
MNEFAEKMELNLTHFDSPHGLMNIENLSCASDLAKLSAVCI